MGNVAEQNPSIADYVTCVTYPTKSSDIQSWTFNDFPSVFIPAQSQNIDVAKKFAASLFNPDGYIQQLHAAPGHVLPVLKSINENPEYQANPIIQKYPNEVDLMSAAAAGGYNLGYESAAHPSNEKAGEVVGSGLIAEMVQRVILNGENVDQVIGETAKGIEDIMKG